MTPEKPMDLNTLQFAVNSIDIALFRIYEDTLQIFLGEVLNPFFKDRLALIGGIIKPKETAEQAVKRLLAEKAGISKVFSEQLQTFSAVDRDPRGRVISVAYIGLTATNPQTSKASIYTTWKNVSQARNLAYDHDLILKVALDRLRAKIGYTNIAVHLLPKKFALSELQRVYEIILGKKIDKRNFRRKVLGAGLVTPTGERTNKNTKKPAKLYRFKNAQQRIIEVL